MNKEILIGDEVECIHTGFKGIVMAKMEFFNRCIQFEVVPRVDKDNKKIESEFIDVQSLKRIKKGQRHSEDDPIEEQDGGPNNKHIKMRGY